MKIKQRVFDQINLEFVKNLCQTKLRIVSESLIIIKQSKLEMTPNRKQTEIKMPMGRIRCEADGCE